MNIHRGCGILLHVSSLPSIYGIGDLGPWARKFIDFLSDSGQSYWQFLPTGPTSYPFGHSPYMSPSAFAGNPLFISPDDLFEEGFLSPGQWTEELSFSEYFVEFEKVVPFKERLLKTAFDRFLKEKNNYEAFEVFCENSLWLDDYALYASLKDEYKGAAWNDWPRDVALRKKDTMEAARRRLADRILFHKFVQFLFDLQWKKMREYANGKGIKLIGDIPIYVSPDSSDVWANQECYYIDSKSLRPIYIAGVPPDYFSETGQRWGNPVYRWKVGGRKNRVLYSWWQARFRRIAELVDVVRVDHFRGFEAYWRIPASEKTAVNGKWIKGPGRKFFDEMAPAIRNLEIIAEDLGTITPEVERLRDHLGVPGMKVLQFAFDSGADNPYLPHNYTTTSCVVYTGTHDNDTTLGWYLDKGVSPRSKERARRYANSDGSMIHKDFIRMAYSSVAFLAIVPMQDVLGFGSDCRMNKPSTSSGNWTWRLAPHFMTEDVANFLFQEAKFYGRLKG